MPEFKTPFLVQSNSTSHFMNQTEDEVNAMRAAAVFTIGITTEVISNPLLFAIIHYEKYGMDPKKRTIVNQLISSLCAFHIYFNLTYLPFWAMSLAFDGIASILAIWVSFGLIVIAMYPIFSTSEIVAMKCFYTLFWSKAARLDDDLLSRLIILTNICYTHIVALVRILLGDYHSHKAARYLECATCPPGYHPKFFDDITFLFTWLPDILSLIIVIIGSAALVVQKTKTKKILSKWYHVGQRCQRATPVESIELGQMQQDIDSSSTPPTSQPTFNTNSQNAVMCNFKASFCLLLAVLILCVPGFLTVVLKLASGAFIINYLYFGYCILVMSLPIIHFISNPNQLRRVKEDIFE